MNQVPIKKVISNGKTQYRVPVLSLKSNNQVKQQIPHPQGNDTIAFDTLEEAINAVKISGFPFVLPDGEEYCENIPSKVLPLEKELEMALLKEISNNNPSVSAAAIYALSELKLHNHLALFLRKMGEDNEKIRNNAIDAVVNYGENAIAMLKTGLEDENWVTRNSTLTAIEKLVKLTNIPPETFLPDLLKMFEDKNDIVKSNAIRLIGELYKEYTGRK